MSSRVAVCKWNLSGVEALGMWTRLRFGADAVTIFQCGGNIHGGACALSPRVRASSFTFNHFTCNTKLVTANCTQLNLSQLPTVPTAGTIITTTIHPLSNIANMEVPTKTSLADIYPEDALQSQTKRWNSLLSTFKDTYGKSADFVSRSPGRVNIIGEVGSGVTILGPIKQT